MSKTQINKSAITRKSIETFGELYDKITKDKQSLDYIIGDPLERVGNLEAVNSKLEITVVDLQCHSWLDNLIFMGNDEVVMEKDEEFEDVGTSSWTAR